MSSREFMLTGEYAYKQSTPIRWLISHIFRYKYVAISLLALSLFTNIAYASIKTLAGFAFNAVQQNEGELLRSIAIGLLLIVVAGGISDIGARLSSALLSRRLPYDAREELYLNLLGKNQTFHNRQRVGDIMARASNDMEQLTSMIVPGLDVTIESLGTLLITFVFIGFLNFQLLLVPFLYMVCFTITLYPYISRLNPVFEQMREQFGEVNVMLNEAVTGIETVKAAGQETEEEQAFDKLITRYRDSYVRVGLLQSSYLPALMLGIFLVLALFHALFLFSQGSITLGTLVAFMILMENFRHITDMSIFSFFFVLSGVAGSKRVLEIIQEKADLSESEEGYRATMQGEVEFKNVHFGYEGNPLLKGISFRAQPGQTIAIVGQVGSGKTTLTKLINRIYDVDQGEVCIDKVNVRDWDLDALRSQIATIEQDTFLFSSTIAENIAYGLEQAVDQETIEAAARDAQAHEFISSLPDGYQTVLGERGVTLSGGQRQRIAIARALLINPRILILDDSTSAVDSLTEDEIQKSIVRVMEGRTTFLITSRLARIRQADSILVLQAGKLLDQGTHQELVGRCEIYRRLFIRLGAGMPVTLSEKE